MNKWVINNVFMLLFFIYIFIISFVNVINVSSGGDWLDSWFFDKFFVFQLMPALIIGLAFTNKQERVLTYFRKKSRRNILKSELLIFYIFVIGCINVLFFFILSIGLFLQDFWQVERVLRTFEWYIRYLTGVAFFLSLTSCLKWTNNRIISKYHHLIIWSWMIFEIIVLKPYLKKFTSFDIYLLFSWIFKEGWSSFVVLLIYILIASMINLKISDKKDFL